MLVHSDISIRALLAEGDLRRLAVAQEGALFQPAPSLRRATAVTYALAVLIDISTRALLAEGDRDCIGKAAAAKLISTRALLAEGDSHGSMFCSDRCRFQPAPSLRRATTGSQPPSMYC